MYESAPSSSIEKKNDCFSRYALPMHDWSLVTWSSLGLTS